MAEKREKIDRILNAGTFTMYCKCSDEQKEFDNYKDAMEEFLNYIVSIETDHNYVCGGYEGTYVSLKGRTDKGIVNYYYEFCRGNYNN